MGVDVEGAEHGADGGEFKFPEAGFSGLLSIAPCSCAMLQGFLKISEMASRTAVFTFADIQSVDRSSRLEKTRRLAA
jgi:hypothetical protein